MPRRRLGWGVAIACLFAAGLLAVTAGRAPGTAPERTAAQASALATELAPVRLTLTPGGCAQDCPEVTVDTFEFVNAPDLTAALRGRLIALAAWAAENDPIAGVDDYAGYADRLFALDAETRTDPEQPPFSADLTAERIERYAGVSVFALDTAVFTGGAHGMPMTAYWMVDEASGRSLSNADLLVAGAAPRLEAALRSAHARWQAEQPKDLDDWPFVMTDQLALRSNGLDATWQVYAIAPYSYGQPTLRLDYAELAGIVKPRFLPPSAVARGPR